jgi:hypothetical protein
MCRVSWVAEGWFLQLQQHLALHGCPLALLGLTLGHVLRQIEKPPSASLVTPGGRLAGAPKLGRNEEPPAGKATPSVGRGRAWSEEQGLHVQCMAGCLAWRQSMQLGAMKAHLQGTRIGSTRAPVGTVPKSVLSQAPPSCARRLGSAEASRP